MASQLFKVYTCQSGCKREDGWGFAFNVPVTIENHPKYGKFETIKDAPTYHQRAGETTWAVHCPQCDKPAQETRKRVRGSVGKTACEEFCEVAEGTTCNCSCGGRNHGIRS